MDEKPVTADVVVACLFAGVGAWGATVTVSPNPTYASELFGAGHASPVYPADMDGDQDGTPVVTLTIPGNLDAFTAVEGPPPVAAMPARNHNGSAEVTITLLAGVFDANVTGLMYDADGAGETAPVPATAAIASIVDGGRKGNNFITIKVEEATGTDEGGRPEGSTARNPSDGTIPNTVTDHTIFFELPRLANLGALAGADAHNANNDEKVVYARAESRIISGSFTDGLITGGAPHYRAAVVKARDSLTLAITPKAATKTIAIKDDTAKGLTAFKSVKEKNAAGYVELATVTVTTKQMAAAAMAGATATATYTLDDDGTPRTISTIAKGPVPAKFHELYDLDGEPIDEGLRGTLAVNAMGTRDLFNEDDMLFIDYDKNGKMGSGEAIAIDGNMGMGDALSVDPDKSDSFDKGGTGVFKVYYMPGGKGDINHGAMINLTAMVDYSDPTAIDEAPMKASTTLNFDGVNSDVDVYAIPFDGNGKGDKANVRVRCEAAAGCRVFLECWDDMGMRSFGKAGMIEGNALVTWDAMDIEGVIGVEDATSRHSCRILSAGMVKVQQLTRDGTSGTLVNNTYIGE